MPWFMAKTSIESLRDELALCLATKPSRDRVPDGFDTSLKSACENDNNERRLLKHSLPTFAAFLLISKAKPEIKTFLDSLRSEELDALVDELPGEAPHNELVKVVISAFNDRKRSSTRRRTFLTGWQTTF